MVVFLLAMISLSIAMKRKKEKIIAMKHRPLIAILSNKEVNRNYIEWIRSGGADVITSFYNDSNINETLDKANEVVMYYTERETNQTLFNTAKNVYNEIKRKNKEYYYPIIAIGEGCNVVQLAEMNMTDTIQYGEYDEKIDYRINFMNDNISNIKLFFYFDGRDLLNIRNMTFNMKTNHSGLDLATYANEEELIKNINPIGYIQHDTDKVVTLLEGKKFPLFGMLFDIVKYIYEDKNKDIKESLITIGQKILNFIVKEAYDGMLNKQVMNIKKNHMKIEKEDNCTKSKVNDTNVIIKEEKKIDIIEVMKENRNETIFKKIKKEIKKYIDNKKNKNNNNTVIDSKKDVNVTEIDKDFDGDTFFPRIDSEKWKEISERMLVDLETASKEWGDKSDGMVQGIKKINRDKYDYATFLRKFSTLREDIQINDDEFDYVYYTLGMERYGNIPLIEPLEYKEVRKVRDFVIAIDTSGSCAGEVVQKFLDKTFSIFMQQENFFRKINLHIIQCDAQIQEVAKITDKTEFEDYIRNLEFKGFGGTDFRPVFAYVEEMMERGEFEDLKGMIYFTDGNGTYPKRRPPYETAFIFVDDDEFEYQVPSWAMKLVLETSDITEEVLI